MMHVTLSTRECANLLTGPLDGWDEDPALQVYVGPLNNNQKYVGWWCLKEWEDMGHAGRTHTLFASGTLYPKNDGVWVGEIVHVLRGKKVRAWKATARKGSRVIEFEPL